MRQSISLSLAPLAAGLLLACGGADVPPGAIEGPRRPEASIAQEQASQDAARRAIDTKAGVPSGEGQILFGDLHVHTTYSADAFVFSLPVFAGEGAHPSADACDFARYCSQLDFFAYTDHAESVIQEHWKAQKDAARQCNALAGDSSNPDMVAFMGFEWTQVGRTPETHFGHKCVIFPGLADEELPARPIDAMPANPEQSLFQGMERIRTLRWFDPLGWGQYEDFGWLVRQIGKAPRCPEGVGTRDLPADCMEGAPTPDVLFEKLAQWGLPVLAIPHGTTWGLYTPPGTSMDKQLTRAYHDPGAQKLIEIASGHGSSEEYRNWREFTVGPDGKKACPAPTKDHLACCWRAGEIMRERCGDLPAAECESRVQRARELYLEQQGVGGHLVFPGTTAEDWLDCGQCRDCFKPTLALRPRESVQYTMALSSPDEKGPDGRPLRFRYGFVASSDNHKARPGTGYKQYARREMTEDTGPRSAFYANVMRRSQRQMLGLDAIDPQAPFDPPEGLGGLLAADTERIASFLYPGGLVAVHSQGRGREDIWNAMQRREVYATSGPRMLLWFDLMNGPQGAQPMGSEVTLSATPRFRVRAVGALEQKPGCPEISTRGLSPERLVRLCRGECYNPSDQRHPIVRIEVVRIRPQQARDEAVGPLIEDPWRRFDCPADPNGCTVAFEDEEFTTSGRDALYYVRALQEPTPAINGANLRTTFDAQGNPIATKPCFGDYRTPFDDDCLAPVQERAWSSPIFVDRAGP
ncbi:MAG: DUF3604 domain-containing protein [Deltaproteobacteria bacterium]|nr:DUF3604 domain-containing protein [Deltaproteobacteria bacterium]